MVEVKGTAIIDAIKAVKERSGIQAFKTICDSLSPEAKTLFSDTALLAPKWYPLELFVEFLGADIKLTADGNETVLIERSEKVIEKELRGIYKIFVKLGSPEFVISRISATHTTYFRGVSIEEQMFTPGKATIKYSGFDKKERLIGYSIIGFYKKALEIAGAKNIEVDFSVPIEAGREYCELEITWTRK